MKKRIISFLMALVMAVSLLPVSAFADDNSNNTTVDIGADEFASDSISPVGTTTIDPMESGEPQNVYLKKIDASVSAIKNESDIWGIYADEVNANVLLEATAGRTSEFVSVAKETYTNYINTVTLNEGVSLSSAENVEHLLLMAYDYDESFFFIIVEWAKPVSVLYTIGDSTENISAAVTQIGTTTLAASTGGIYLVSLPENAKINLISFLAPKGATLAMYGFYNKGGIKTYANALPADITSAYADSENYLVDSEFGSDNANFTGTQVFSSTLPTEYVKGFMIRCWWPEQATINILYVQKAIEVKDTNKTALNAAIASVTGENADKYFQSDDRWNGNATSENGFWSDMLSKLTVAQTVAADNTASQTEVDTAAAALQAAITKLIPTDRVNATALYEALNTDWRWIYGGDLRNDITNGGDPVSADNCTPLSWQPYAKALKDGRALLEQLYKDGKPTDENTASKQGEVDKLAAAADAHKLVNKESYAAAYDKYMAAKPEAEALLKQYDPAKLKESDYTAASWKTYTDAYDTLKADVDYRVVGGTTEDYAMLSSFSQHMTALKNAYRQLTSATDVTVSFTYINNFSALYPGFGGTSLYTNSSLTLAAGTANLLGAYNAANIELDTHDDKSLPGYYYINTGDTNPQFLVFINGSCAGLYIWSFRDSTLYPQYALSAVQLHNGDSVKMVRVAMPLFNKEDSSGLDSSAWNLLSASEEHYQSSVALIDMTAPGSAKVGDKAKFSATVTGANATNLGSGKSAAGITLFISDPSETEALSQPTHKTAAATGADGSLQYVFTKPGWYTVAMFNVTPDDYTRVDIYGSTNAIGEYYSLYGGDYALIHVTEADDTDALLKQYRTEKAAEAKAYFDSFHDYDFTAEGYEAFKAQYETLTANLQKAIDLTALMETYGADFTRLKELGAAVIDHAAVIAGLRQNLSYLPDELNDLNANYKQLVKDIQTVYGGLNSYQKKLLSANETKRLDAVAKIDADSLTALAVVKLAMGANNDNNFPYNKDNSQGAARFGYETLKWKQTPNPDGTLPSMSGNWWRFSSGLPATAMAGDHVFLRYYLNTTDEQYWPVWSVDGGNTWNLTEPLTLTSVHGVDWSGYYLAEYVIPSDVADGSTVTFDVKMISKTEYQAMTADSADAVAAAQAAALAHLETVKNGLKGSVEKAYQAGVKAIQAATSVAAVESAYQNAVRAMKKAATGFGKVHVIVENTTFTRDMWPKNKEYWDGTLVDTWVDLEHNSTMMTCIVAALDKFGYKQSGAESNYIATINGLSEKDGNTKSGWMGTLNDWFTNYGFGAFSVAEGDLSDGDVIRVMYTNNTTNDNAGGDLGGTWGNKNTTLSDLTVSGGQLLTEFTPGQSGGTYEYTLAIDSAEADIQVTPTAANKNYLTKIFLNEKVTDNTEGFSFYKRTQTIPVKAGDVIYVGCGENGWPTMNGSGQRGTWYVLRVIDVNADASTVTGMINDLPEVSSVKYGNYQLYMNAVAAARASFNALSKDQQKLVDTTELEKLEAAIAQFQAIDEVKDKLDKLPSAGDLTIEDQEAVKAAKEAYDKLTDEQKAELTGMEIEKMGELTTRMDEIVKDNSKPKPGKPGNGGNNSSAKNPYQKDNGKDVKSGNTGDAGITLYVGMGLVAVLAGAVIITRKRKEN